ncbi:MAG: cytochrome c oxidase subunit 3 family protein [Candidatus Kapabacteria bacterium]|jgi:heme/copper-type cytochrome/quinol oxidase subunit 3|nr:cytochrome c oxidase subunit 3 family protein [Candidatus Kapabacteria bacterium]
MSSALSLAHEPVTGIRHGKLGMWIFLASEVMFFSGFFTAFIILRNSNLSVFAHGASELNWPLAALNTVNLIVSSLTMAMAILSLEHGNKSKFQLYMGITFLCACGFLVIKYIEYTTKFAHGIFPGTNSFFGLYFTMTGFHAIHVIGGMLPIGWMLAKSFTKRGYQDWERVEILGLYWHFVDLVWIFLFPVLYLIF